MKYVICFFIISLSIQAKELAMLTDLSDLRWENRVIVVSTVNDKDSISKIFEQHETELNERDIVWFIMQNNTVSSNFSGNIADNFVPNMIQNYKINAQLEQGNVMLIGKDGGIKWAAKRLNLADIFSKIDSMPMRQVEMRPK
ncbi:DUF4174 domain-containing protein [Vibrio sp. 2-Bac 85]|uniref:DUF4174 domain-containing protein n=1 Tax=uncultured Psychromonas sp. TaxID=173974 RepID=UPI0026367259|nr:DUF4174 domain-containing protein [uncultured Psychromonas sp.]